MIYGPNNQIYLWSLSWHSLSLGYSLHHSIPIKDTTLCIIWIARSVESEFFQIHNIITTSQMRYIYSDVFLHFYGPFRTLLMPRLNWCLDQTLLMPRLKWCPDQTLLMPKLNWCPDQTLRMPRLKWSLDHSTDAQAELVPRFYWCQDWTGALITLLMPRLNWSADQTLLMPRLNGAQIGLYWWPGWLVLILDYWCQGWMVPR